MHISGQLGMVAGATGGEATGLESQARSPSAEEQDSTCLSVLSADAPLGECSFPGALLQAEAGGWWQSCLPSQALL